MFPIDEVSMTWACENKWKIKFTTLIIYKYSFNYLINIYIYIYIYIYYDNYDQMNMEHQFKLQSIYLGTIIYQLVPLVYNGNVQKECGRNHSLNWFMSFKIIELGRAWMGFATINKRLCEWMNTEKKRKTLNRNLSEIDRTGQQKIMIIS